ncbi:MAG: ATP-binding protein [Verrucomicrobiota bacterium]
MSPSQDTRANSTSDAVNKDGSEATNSDTETIRQLQKIVAEFTTKYPSHTQRIPSMRQGEHILIAFVRQMVNSMAQKQAELEALNREVEAHAAEKERFLANVSHEVRTPMNGIFGMIHLLLEMDLDPVMREYLETIQGSSESLLNILDDILDYSKLNSGQMDLKPRAFDINKLVRDVLLVYRPSAEEKGIKVSAIISDAIPDFYFADDLRLKQILSNLVSNAIKFTEKGGVSLKVRIVERKGKKQLLFEVKDSGIGIPKDAAAKLFSPFSQLDAKDGKRYKGTGLGLTISKNLIELMGGKIWFESVPDEGTRFFCTCDFEEAEAPTELVTRGAMECTEEEEAPSDEIEVLLAEDNPINQKVASLSLKQLGCTVTIASDGEEAVAIASSNRDFDFICMDVNMPKMDGMEATRQIRELDHPNAQTHIIAMTGMAFDEDLDKCLASGMNDVVTKPFDLQDLRKKVDQIRLRKSEGLVLAS